MANAEETRREAYERRQKELMDKCSECRKRSTFPPSFERCNYDCTTGRKLHMLEVEYSDVTGWTHQKW